ncbi:protein angel homolog 2 [Hydra vulgaris]|uniref:Protein angel homolog 2 n=1 Tax=Hydra vulgaris TaxID=6087 RepID=T2MBH1_HYDVU|nr:protein angel homolog 2 [Hydra vulgaris]
MCSKPLFRNFRCVGRNWVKRPLPEHLSKSPDVNFEFTVASYNVLADCLLKEHSYLYRNAQSINSPWLLDWNYRKHNLLKEIIYADADVLCLQEVEEEHYYNWFYPRLKDFGYDGIYKRRSGDKRDGCATFFKLNRFSFHSIELLDFYHPNIPLMDRNNVAILLFLTPRSNHGKNKSPICIGNTHLLFNKNRGDIKLAQISYIFAEIDRLKKSAKFGSCFPMVICGDFNSLPFSPLYHFITKGQLCYNNMNKAALSGQNESSYGFNTNNIVKDPIFPDALRLTSNCKWKHGISLNEFHLGEKNVAPIVDNHIQNKQTKPSGEFSGVLSHDFCLNSCYMHYLPDGAKEVTTSHNRACSTVDFIFYSSNSETKNSSSSNNSVQKNLCLSGVLSLLSESDLKSMGQLPNGFISSDHLMLLSSFILH